MNIFLCVYNWGLFYVILSVAPFYWFIQKFFYKNKTVLSQRLGIYSVSLSKRVPTIWIHASSVGEVKVAYRIINILRSKFEGVNLVLSTTTVSGNEYAKKLAKVKVKVIFAPLDLSYCVRFALSKIRPNIIVYIETEIWPNWINEAHNLGITTIFLNGRISRRSLRKYKKIIFLIKFILSKVDIFSMASHGDKSRIISIGAPENRVVVNGNAKFDLIKSDYSYYIFERMYKLYNLFDNPPVFVAGSIRASEETSIIDAYIKIKSRFTNVVLVIAPRHMNRVSKIEKLTKTKGLKTVRRSNLTSDSPRRDPVIILDTIGELTASYSIATVAFCGASLVKLGGQNILEAAAWAKPVIHGPFMDDFKEASNLLQKNKASIMVNSSSELAEAVMFLLDNLEHTKQMGYLARKVILSNQGIANKHATVVGKIIEKFT